MMIRCSYPQLVLLDLLQYMHLHAYLLLSPMPFLFMQVLATLRNLNFAFLPALFTRPTAEATHPPPAPPRLSSSSSLSSVALTSSFGHFHHGSTNVCGCDARPKLFSRIGCVSVSFMRYSTILSTTLSSLHFISSRVPIANSTPLPPISRLLLLYSFAIWSGWSGSPTSALNTGLVLIRFHRNIVSWSIKSHSFPWKFLCGHCSS